MKIDIPKATYVVAVSGGVDSMVLLDLLTKVPELKLVVAHFDHGIRPDSAEDRKLVQAAAERYGLPFVYDEGRLGAGASEATAREARYKFLTKVKKAAGAKAIVTAHHQDDLLETAIINLLRGTNRRGLSSLQDRKDILRPLLKTKKAELIKYANKHKIIWREDLTNKDEAYLRNFVRHSLLPKFSEAQKQSMLGHILKLGQLNNEIDVIINKEIKNRPELDRHWFTMLDHNVARDVMATWLRNQDVTEIDKKQLEILVRAAKTYRVGKSADVDKNHQLKINKDKLALSVRER